MIGTVAGRRSVASPIHFDILQARKLMVDGWRLRLSRAAWQIDRQPATRCPVVGRQGRCLLICGHALMDRKSLDYSRTHRYKGA